MSDGIDAVPVFAAPQCKIGAVFVEPQIRDLAHTRLSGGVL